MSIYLKIKFCCGKPMEFKWSSLLLLEEPSIVNNTFKKYLPVHTLCIHYLQSAEYLK